MGPCGSHHGTGDFPTQRILTAELTPTGYKKEDYHGPGDGLHERRRDIEYGMVSVYEFDDIEYRSLDRTRRVVGDSDGSGDTGVEGVEPFLRREEKPGDCMDGCILLLLSGRGFES